LNNLYTYLRNNPLRFVDPNGEILQISGDVKEAQAQLCEIVGGDAVFHGMAMEFLGFPVHAATDKWSPAHIGYQEWYGWRYPGASVPHVLVDTFGGVRTMSRDNLLAGAEHEARVVTAIYEARLAEERRKKAYRDAGKTECPKDERQDNKPPEQKKK